MRNHLYNLGAVVFSYVAAIPLGYYFGKAYSEFVTVPGGSWIGGDASDWLVGYPLASIFIITFVLHALGYRNVWWWNFLVLLPVILLELAADLEHIYIPVILGAIGWLFGVAINALSKELIRSNY